MKKTWISIWLLCLLAALALTACGSAEDSGPSTLPEAESSPAAAPEEIIDCVVENFCLLAEVPRPSHHEEAIGAFLMNWAEEQGLRPVMDEAGNVMVDVPPSQGLEEYPLVILQGHMDMVVAVEDGKDFDPLTDPIAVIRDEEANTLKADGTSLGSDDGAGCAIIMAVVQGRTPHGPLRVLITTDEEDGMEGAFNMDASWLENASYLINIDNETSSDVLVSTAAGDSMRFSRSAGFRDAAGDLALTVELSGLTGGHSGIEINKGRLNGLIGLAGFLKDLREHGVSCELARFAGGTASNAIPNRAACTIVISAGDADAVKERAETYLTELKEAYAGIEDGMSLRVTEEDSVPQVLSEEDRESLVRFMTELIDGVNTWSADMDGLVESSSNLGIFTLDENGISGSSYIRSSVGEKEQEILDAQAALASSCGYETETVKMADPWPYDPDSRLLAMTKEIYLAQNGEEINVSAVHAGLECGTIKFLNPDLDMISIGPDISDAHTTRETLFLDSVPKVCNLLAELLIQIGKE